MAEPQDGSRRNGKKRRDSKSVLETELTELMDWTGAEGGARFADGEVREQ